MHEEYEGFEIQKFGLRKYFNLIAYVCLGTTNVFSFVLYSPIWASAMAYYSITDSLTLQWYVNVQYIPIFAFGFFVVIVKRYGLTILFGALLTLIGSWIIYFAHENYTIALIGAFINGTAQPCYLVGLVFISESYFSEFDRSIVNFLCCFSTTFGITIGFAFTSFYFNDITDQETINQMIEQTNLINAICNTFSSILCFLLIRSEPNNGGQISQRFNTFIDDMKCIFKNESYLLDLGTFSIILGISWEYLTIITQACSNYGLTPYQGSIVGVIYQISGVISGLAAGYILDKETREGLYPTYDKILLILSTTGFISLFMLTMWMESMSFSIIAIVNVFVGGGVNSTYPVFIQAFTEKLHPVSSGLCCMFILINANLVGFVLNYILALPIFLLYGLWIALIIITPFQLYLIIFYKTKFRRFESIVK